MLGGIGRAGGLSDDASLTSRSLAESTLTGGRITAYAVLICVWHTQYFTRPTEDTHDTRVCDRGRGAAKAIRADTVLDGLDLRIPRASVLALLGPNGAGKTTAVRLLSTLTAPDGGRATVAGHDVVADPASVRRAISLTGQYAALDELQTGTENLRMIGRLAGLSPRSARARAAELLDRFELVASGARRVGTYSGGMRRRLDLAASLVRPVEVLFLDEPTTGLDPRSRLRMWELVSELRADGTTVLLTTQYLEEADRLADRIVVIDAGRVVAEGTASELKRQVADHRLELIATGPDAYSQLATRAGDAHSRRRARTRYASASLATGAPARSARGSTNSIRLAR